MNQEKYEKQFNRSPGSNEWNEIDVAKVLIGIKYPRPTITESLTPLPQSSSPPTSPDSSPPIRRKSSRVSRPNTKYFNPSMSNFNFKRLPSSHTTSTFISHDVSPPTPDSSSIMCCQSTNMSITNLQNSNPKITTNYLDILCEISKFFIKDYNSYVMNGSCEIAKPSNESYTDRQTYINADLTVDMNGIQAAKSLIGMKHFLSMYKEEEEFRAKLLFDKIQCISPSEQLFHDQALVIFKCPAGQKSNGNFRDILKAELAYLVQRNSSGQIYACMNLHNCLHGTIPLSMESELSEVCRNVRLIRTSENIIMNDFAVWNQDGKKYTFLSDVKSYISKIAVGCQEAFHIPCGKDKRGNVSVNIGFTKTDSYQYSKNRCNILGNVTPFLIKMDSITDEAKSAIGGLAIYLFDNIMPVFEKDEYKIPNTQAGKGRAELRKLLARKLHIAEDDLHKFCFEAVTIIIPVQAKLHRDRLNDSTPNSSTTITVNSTLPMSLILEKKILNYLTKLGYKDFFPCSVIFNSRKVCRQYYDLLNHMYQFGKKSSLHGIIAETIMKIDKNRDHDYFHLFDCREHHSSIIRQVEAKDDECKVDGVEVPFTFDIMAKWSIIVDHALHYHCCLAPVKVISVLQYILLIILCDDIQFIHKKISTFFETRPALDFGSICRSILHDKFPNYDVNYLTWELFELCGRCKSAITGKRQSALLYRDLMDFESIGAGSFRFDWRKSQEFVQLAAIFGLFPLQWMYWTTIINKEHSLYKNIALITSVVDLEEQRTLFHGLVNEIRHFTSSHIATEMLVENIIKVYVDHGDIQKNVYFFLDYKEEAQHFYRVKQSLEALRKPSEHETRTSKSTLALTRWRNDSIDEVRWSEKDGKIQMDSELLVPSHFHELFSIRKLNSIKS